MKKRKPVTFITPLASYLIPKKQKKGFCFEENITARLSHEVKLPRTNIKWPKRDKRRPQRDSQRQRNGAKQPKRDAKQRQRNIK